MGEEQEEKKKGGIPLDMDKLLDNDEPPQNLAIATTIHDIDDNVEKSQREDLFRMKDKELEETIAKKKRTLETLGPKLPDGGGKIKAVIKQLEAEIEHRRLRLEKDNDGCEKLTQSKGSYFTSLSDGLRQETPSSLPALRSTFTTIFGKTLEERTNSRAVNAFEGEFSVLRCGRRCGRGKITYNGKSSPKKQPTATLSTRQLPFQCPTKLSVDGNKHVHLNGRKNGGYCSIGFPPILEEKSSVPPSKRRKLSQVKSPNIARPRNAKFVVVDEEEPELPESIEPEDKVDECMKDSKIYYPSSDDPESIEICYSDMECLAPQAYLSSTIMNFYIRYLQQTNAPTDRTRCDYHIFNTYFYNKLKEAVSRKNNIQESYFIKFRRWWKGVNIFHKAYILLPIHECLHWSLVIICIPDKEDESGPILLHLDSLGLHSSKAIFENIKSFLREEWNVLKGGEALPDLPIADKIWKNLPRRFEERQIQVPQQRNAYDCGLFVLYFMERFINGAPPRLKKKDLAMFGNKWFKPEEASNLRRKVRKLLVDEFRNATQQNCI